MSRAFSSVCLLYFESPPIEQLRLWLVADAQNFPNRHGTSIGCELRAGCISPTDMAITTLVMSLGLRVLFQKLRLADFDISAVNPQELPSPYTSPCALTPSIRVGSNTTISGENTMISQWSVHPANVTKRGPGRGMWQAPVGETSITCQCSKTHRGVASIRWISQGRFIGSSLVLRVDMQKWNCASRPYEMRSPHFQSRISYAPTDFFVMARRLDSESLSYMRKIEWTKRKQRERTGHMRRTTQ